MLKEKIADGREVFESNITHSLEVGWLSLCLEISDQISFVCHKLVLCCRNYSCSIFTFTNIGLSNLEQFLLLKWRNLWANHHIWNVGKCHEGLLHRLISKNFNEGSACEDYNISLAFFCIFSSLCFLISILLLKHFFHFVALFLGRFWFLTSSGCAITHGHVCLFLLKSIWSTFLRHSIRNNLQSILYLIHHNSFPLSVDYQWCCTILKHS